MKAARYAMLSIVLGGLGCSKPAPAPQGSFDQQVVQIYRNLRDEPSPMFGKSKYERLFDEEDHLRNPTGRRAGDPIPESTMARHIALKAFLAEAGGTMITTPPPEIDTTIQKAYGPDLRKGWSPEMRRIWLLATFVPTQSPIPPALTEMEALRNEGQDLTAMEATLIGVGEKPDIDGTIEKLLAFSESHPNDLVAASRVLGLLYLQSVSGPNVKPYKVRQSFVDRILVLEERTLKNYREFMHEDNPVVKRFDRVREIPKRTYAEANGS